MNEVEMANQLLCRIVDLMVLKLSVDDSRWLTPLQI